MTVQSKYFVRVQLADKKSFYIIHSVTKFEHKMLRTRFISLRNKQFITSISSLRCQSTQSNPEPTEKSAPGVDTFKSYTGVKAAEKSSGKLPRRDPLVKNFFVGKVDKDMLGFPEVINREDMAKLQTQVAGVQSFFESVDNAAIESTKSIPKEVVENVQALGLYGINAPDQYGGKDWKLSQSLMASEAEVGTIEIACGLLSHRVVIDTLNEIGTESQKELYLAKLANGSVLATEAIFEYDDAVDGIFNTTASHDVNAGVWILNGEKSFVVNGPAAGLYLVIAQTAKLNMVDDAGKTTTIFLVDRSTPGVKVGEQHKTIGTRGLRVSRVQFDNVKVPESAVLGDPNEASATAEVILRSTRLRSAMIGLGLSKKILNELTQHCIKSKQSGVALKDLESIRKHIAKLMTSTYAMESMIYLTAGLFDEFEDQDIGLESAVTKYYTLTRLFENSTKYMDVIGPKSLLSGQSTEIDFRNATQLYTQGEPIESLRMYISLTGLQHSGIALNDTTSSVENPKSKLRLGDALHPSLEAAAQTIERSISRLHMVVELLLTKYGQQIIERHIDLERLTEIAAHIYAMFASASRASRSYCIGLQLSDHELLLALTICAEGEAKVKTLTYEILNGPFMTTDHNINRLTKQVFKSGGYFAEHPLKYNF